MHEIPYSLLVFGTILAFIPSLLLAAPSAMILARVGHSPWWALLVFVPLVNYVALWVFAFGKWPAQGATEAPPSPRVRTPAAEQAG